MAQRPMEDFYTSLNPEKDSAYDVIWFNQAITPERQKLVTFTQPYGLFDEAVLVKSLVLFHLQRG